MSIRVPASLRAALAAGCALTLTAACGDGKKAEPKVVPDRSLPSVAREPAGHASVTPTPVAPVIAPRPEPTPVVAPDDGGTKKKSAARPVAHDFDGHLAEGKKLYAAGDYRDALTFFEQAAVVKPKSALARVHVARTLLAMGDKREARKYVEQALELDPESSIGWNTLGRIELAEKDLEAAVASFRRAAEAEPESSHAWNNLGYTLMTLGHHEEAAEALENATAGTSPTEYMWNNLGMAYEHIDRIREARAAYRQAAGLGSAKGEANMTRLDGVKSLKRSGDGEVSGGVAGRIVTP
jgi:Flp pilus assembly protein TadD